MQRGQLGHGDQTQRNVPTVVEALAGKSIVSGALPRLLVRLLCQMGCGADCVLRLAQDQAARTTPQCVLTTVTRTRLAATCTCVCLAVRASYALCLDGPDSSCGRTGPVRHRQREEHAKE